MCQQYQLLLLSCKCLTILEQTIADSEIKLGKIDDINLRIEELLNRQLMDGLLTYSDYYNFRSINTLCSSLLIHPRSDCTPEIIDSLLSMIKDKVQFSSIVEQLCRIKEEEP